MISIMGMLRLGAASDSVRSQLKATPQVQRSAVSRGKILNFVADRSQLGIDYARGGLEVDCFAQHLFSDVSGSIALAETGGFDVLGGIPEDAVEEMTIVSTLQNTVIAPPKSGAIKRMSILRKRQDVSSEFFQDEWFNMHSILVKRLPGVMGYRQNLVIDAPNDDDGFVIDGIVELWFPDMATIDKAFRSPRGITTMTHAKEFIDQITTYLIDPVVVEPEQ